MKRCECMWDGHREWTLETTDAHGKIAWLLPQKASNNMKLMSPLMCSYIVFPPEISFWNSHECLDKEQRKSSVLVAFTRETEPTGCIYTRKGMYYKESSHAVMELRSPTNCSWEAGDPEKPTVPVHKLSGLRPKKS